MKIRIVSCAEQEFLEAVDFYNEQRPGLGYEFAVEIKKTLGRIFDFPEVWPKLSKRARRCLVNKFPFGIIYQIRQDCILVVAIMHMKRNPVLWQNRIED